MPFDLWTFLIGKLAAEKQKVEPAVATRHSLVASLVAPPGITGALVARHLASRDAPQILPDQIEGTDTKPSSGSGEDKIDQMLKSFTAYIKAQTKAEDEDRRKSKELLDKATQQEKYRQEVLKQFCESLGALQEPKYSESKSMSEAQVERTQQFKKEEKK